MAVLTANPPGQTRAATGPVRPPLPPYVGYYLRHLLAGRYRLVPSERTPPKLAGRLIVFTGQQQRQLRRVPESPQFHEALKARGSHPLMGTLDTSPGQAPVLVLDGLGGWTLRLPKHGKEFQRLRELRVPNDLQVIRSREQPPTQPGRPLRRQHLIPLRYHPRALLVVAILIYPSGHVAYEAWVWHAAQRVEIPLYWDEAKRCIDLFRDMAASWAWTDATPKKPPPRHSAAGSVPSASEVRRAGLEEAAGRDGGVPNRPLPEQGADAPFAAGRGTSAVRQEFGAEQSVSSGPDGANESPGRGERSVFG